ncbi:MAG: putative transposase [Bacteroidia bacterium]
MAREQWFSSFFQSYTRAINKMYERTGPLFESPFKRIAVKDEAYFSQLITYIHHNPVKLGFVTDFRDYAYSSYHAHLGSSDTKLNRQDVLDWFLE